MQYTNLNRNNVYSLNNIGVEYKGNGDLIKALDYFLESLKAWKEINFKQGISTSLNNIGYIYFTQNNLAEALNYYKRGLCLQKEIGNTFGIANSLNNIGAVYHKIGDEKKALEYSGQAYFISSEQKYPQYISRAAKLLSDIYSRLAEKSLSSKSDYWKKAYEYHQVFSRMKDTLLNEESNKQITEMQTKYETEKKEQQITLGLSQNL